MPLWILCFCGLSAVVGWWMYAWTVIVTLTVGVVSWYSVFVLLCQNISFQIYCTVRSAVCNCMGCTSFQIQYILCKFFNMCVILSFSVLLRHHVQQYIMYAECFDGEWCPFQAVYYDCKWKSDSSHSCDTKQSTSGQFSAEEWMCTVSTWFGVILSVSSHLFKF